jgi:hypothetical protein
MTGSQKEENEGAKSSEAEFNQPISPPIIPAQIIPSASVIQIPQAAIEALKTDPEKLLKYLEKYDETQSGISKIKAENQNSEQIETQKTRRLGMGLVFAIALSVLVYSGLTGNKEFLEKVTIAAISSIAGFGVGISQKKKDDG